MKILYLHGLNGNPESQTAKWFNSEFGAVTPVGLDLLDYEDTIKKISNIECDIVVGNSLGGFYANYFANKKQIPQILINPCFHPDLMLLKINKKISNYNELHQFSINSDTGSLVILSNEDELFSEYWDLLKSKLHFTQFKSINGKHKLTLDNLEEIKQTINEFLRNLI